MNRLVQTGKNFMEYTSLHGLARVADSKYWLKKLAWCLLFLGSLGMCLFQVTRLFEQFFNFQVNTKIVLENEAQRFPGVAICNVNPTQYEQTVKIPQLFRIIRELSIKSGIGLEEFSLGAINVNESLYVNNTYVNDGMHDNIIAFDHAIQTFQLEMARLPDDLLGDVSQTADKFVYLCQVNRAECNYSMIKPYRDPHFGVCFSLESDHVVNSPGESYGLEVFLNIDQHNYLPFLTLSEGVKVHIYDTYYPPSVANEGIALPVGFEVDIGITKKINNRLPGPDEKCDVQNTYSNMRSCVESCIDKEVRRHCKCDRTYVEEEEEEEIYYCTDDDVTCVLDVMAETESDLACSECKSPCNQITFEKSISMRKWPSLNFEPFIKKYENNDSAARKETMVLRVYYTSLLTESITEEMAYTSENFVSDIGGQLGLWIGMSVLSMAEVVELVLLLVYACVRKTKTEDNEAVLPNQKKEFNENMTVIEIE